MALPQESLSFYSAPNTLHYNEHPVSVSIVRKFGRDEVWGIHSFQGFGKNRCKWMDWAKGYLLQALI